MSGGGRKLTLAAAVSVAAVLFAMSPSEVPADSTYHDVDVDADGQTDGQACRTPSGVPCDSTVPPGTASEQTTATPPPTTPPPTTVPPTAAPSLAPGAGEAAPIVPSAAPAEVATSAAATVTVLECVGYATVRRGDTWPILADRLDVWTADLKAANAQAVRDGLMAGATVCVPAGPGDRDPLAPGTTQPRTTTTAARPTTTAPRTTTTATRATTTTTPPRAPQEPPTTTNPKHRPGPGAPTTTAPVCALC